MLTRAGVGGMIIWAVLGTGPTGANTAMAAIDQDATGTATTLTTTPPTTTAWTLTPPSTVPASPTTGPSTTGPSTTTTTTVPVPPPVDEAALHADQEAVVSARYDAEISADQTRLSAAQSDLAADGVLLAQSQQQGAGAAAAVASSQRTLAGDRAALTAAVRAHTTAGQALASDRNRLGGMAIELYEGIPAPTATGWDLPGLGGTTTALQGAEEDAFGETLVATAAASIDRDVHRDVSDVAATTKRDGAIAATIARDSGALAGDQHDATSAMLAEAAARAAQSKDQRSLSSVQDAMAAAESARTTAVSALAGTEAAPVAATDTSPTIIGPSALTAADLVAWFNGSGGDALTAASIQQLAQWYISEGAAEGVRGDLAFAQAIIETGGFTSSDATALNNYAGIGHCNSCAAGWAFPSPQLGIRGQVQLLRAYAEPGLVVSQLAAPPAIAQVAPQLQFRRGCCATWQSLTGVWATDPIYGPVILNLYQQMLDYTLANPTTTG